MRIWDIPCSRLCRKHLLGEHRELHCIFNVITKGKKGYSRHPETLRWVGKLGALIKRHDEQVKEMLLRGYNHRSQLDVGEILDSGEGDIWVQDIFVDSVEEQVERLKEKGCECDLESLL